MWRPLGESSREGSWAIVPNDRARRPFHRAAIVFTHCLEVAGPCSATTILPPVPSSFPNGVPRVLESCDFVPTTEPQTPAPAALADLP